MADKNNLIVYCEYEDGKVADVSLELLTKGRQLADKLGIKLEAVVAGDKLEGIEQQILPYGVDTVYKFEDSRLYPYTSLPHSSILINLFKEIQPRIAFMGATSIGRDLGPRVSSALHSGLTADCTSLEIGDYTDAKTGTEYKDLLYQIRPAFGGNIVATIVNPECRPQTPYPPATTIGLPLRFTFDFSTWRSIISTTKSSGDVYLLTSLSMISPL